MFSDAAHIDARATRYQTEAPRERALLCRSKLHYFHPFIHSTIIRGPHNHQTATLK